MKILHLEDNLNDAALAAEILTAEFPNCAITVVSTRENFLAQLAAAPPDLILSDFSMPAFDGLAARQLAQERGPDIPFIFLSGTIGEERAVEAVRAGAYDYVIKDRMARLPMAVRHAVEASAQRRLHVETERRLREQADIIDRASEAILVSDLDGRITYWNRGAARIFGIAAADAIGRSGTELFPSIPPAEIDAARRTTDEKGECRCERSVLTPDGREIVIDLLMMLIRDDNGRPKARLSTATDITERKRLEEQFLRTQRLESIGLLSAGIAHDLNNVLAPVLMAAPLLRQHAADPSCSRVLDILESSAERGAGLVRQILGFAHGSGTGFRPVQVKQLIRDVGDFIQASFPKSIVLEENVPSELWPVQANPTQVHQILLNLAVNARDAMVPRGGALRLSAANRELDERAAGALEGARPGSFVMLEVADTGSGMAPEVLARIWEPFFTTKGESQGTGLGLSTVRGIAVSHGGFVAVETELGRGTTFRVFLPAIEQTHAAGAALKAPAAPRGQGELLLVVDDEQSVRETATAILNQHGYSALGCCDGVEAIGLFTRHNAQVRLVITDINMPGLDGPALALVLRRLRSDVKIMAITGLDSHGTSGSHAIAPFTVKLLKPFTAETLLNAVHQTLNRASSGGERSATT